MVKDTDSSLSSFVTGLCVVGSCTILMLCFILSEEMFRTASLGVLPVFSAMENWYCLLLSPLVPRDLI
ncbi:MAG: hypothetical protein IKR44_03780, partial [Bacteroidales bacterium]|nr:hypothetical protein [Bacteroidales bacterium]